MAETYHQWRLAKESDSSSSVIEGSVGPFVGKETPELGTVNGI